MACVWIWYCSAGDRVGTGAVSGTVCAMVLSATLATRGLFRDSTGAGAIGAGSATAATGAGASGSATTATAGATGAAGGALGARFAFGAGGGGGSGIGSTTCTMGSGVGSTTCAIGSMVSFGLFFEPGGRPLPLLAGSAPSGSVGSVGSIFFIWRKKTHLIKRRRVTRPLIAGALWPACNIAFPRAVWGVGWVRNVGASVFLAWSRYRSGAVVPRGLYFI